MKKLFLVIICGLVINYSEAQISRSYKYSELKPENTININLNDSEIQQIIDNQKFNLIINELKKDSLSGWSHNQKPAIINTQESSIKLDITDEIKNRVGNDSSKTIQIRHFNISFYFITKWAKNKQDNPKENSRKTREMVLQTFLEEQSFRNPYDYKKNFIHLFFDESGRLLNHLPVNLDQDDRFLMYILCKKEDKERYRININEGEYSPVDLSMRNFDIITLIRSQSTGAKKSKTDEYDFITLNAGPFTTENFSFQIAFDSINGETYYGPSYKVKINKLYHVGVGVSIVNTWLENPDFRIAPLGDGTNTIESYNTGPRTALTFNVIWYWTVLHQNKRGSVITKGRDVLKDEPTWSINRVYPTVGVSLDSKLSENFFAGFVYEFARGGSIIAGVHYGRVRELSEKKFELNKTIFNGTNEEIRINNVYKPAFFIGINVDTRIFNTLFGKGQ